MRLFFTKRQLSNLIAVNLDQEKKKNSVIFCVCRADGMYADPEAECQVGGNEDDDLDEDDHEDGGDNDAFDGNDH